MDKIVKIMSVRVDYRELTIEIDNDGKSVNRSLNAIINEYLNILGLLCGVYEIEAFVLYLNAEKETLTMGVRNSVSMWVYKDFEGSIAFYIWNILLKDDETYQHYYLDKISDVLYIKRRTNASNEEEHGAVNHPDHYAKDRNYEPIDIIEDWGLNFMLGNAVKYISRAGRKGDPCEDLKKAKWYLEREIQKLSRKKQTL